VHYWLFFDFEEATLLLGLMERKFDAGPRVAAMRRNPGPWNCIHLGLLKKEYSPQHIKNSRENSAG